MKKPVNPKAQATEGNTPVLKASVPAAEPRSSPDGVAAVSRRHLRFGWWSLAGYLSFGIFLEVVHGFKWGWYVDAGNETRRLMFTLAHAHGTLLAIINVVVGVSLRVMPTARVNAFTSYSLVWAGLLLPFGFFLGGIVTYGGDPGMGILLVPIGALLLLYGVICAARAFTKKEG